MLQAILTYITHHLDEEISLDSLAKLTGYSPYHLHRLIRAELKEPIGNYIKRQRLETAAYLLALTQIPVAQVKWLVGYENDSSFCKAFKDFSGVSPKAYRTSNIFKIKVNALPNSYLSLNWEIVTLPPQQATVFPSLGNYFSKEVYQVWQEVEEYLNTTNLDPAYFDFYSLLHVCQHTAPAATDSRYDAALVYKFSPAVFQNKFLQREIPGGKFVRYKFCCPVVEYSQMSLLVARHMNEVANLKHRDGISYFKFNSLPDYKNPDNLLIDWLLPIE